MITRFRHFRDMFILPTRIDVLYGLYIGWSTTYTRRLIVFPARALGQTTNHFTTCTSSSLRRHVEFASRYGVHSLHWRQTDLPSTVSLHFSHSEHGLQREQFSWTELYGGQELHPNGMHSSNRWVNSSSVVITLRFCCYQSLGRRLLLLYYIMQPTQH